MQTRPTLRKLGVSVMLPIPQRLLLSSEGDVIKVEPAAPRSSPEAVEFMARFTKKYDEAMRYLAGC